MKPISVLFILATFLGLVLTSCAKSVTNNVNTNEPPVETALNKGVVLSGGGRGVRCVNDGLETLEVVDLFDARHLHMLTVLDFGSSEEAAKDKLAGILAKHLNPSPNAVTPAFKNQTRLAMVDNVIKQIRFTDAGKKLRVVHDNYAPLLDEGCHFVQIAVYNAEGDFLVDRALWDKLDLTNRMALIAEKNLHTLARKRGATNSFASLKLVALLFSTHGPRSIADGISLDEKKELRCLVEGSGKVQSRFSLYTTKQDDSPGLAAVFSDFGSEQALFHTEAFFARLSFRDLEAPTFSEVRESSMVIDTFPGKTRVRLQFNGIADGKIKATLHHFRSATDAADVFEVNCQLPANFADLKERVTEARTLQHVQASGSIDVVSIDFDGSLVFEQTRQVGGPGGLGGGGLAPYPTVCRYRERAFITGEHDDEIYYQVSAIEPGDNKGLDDSAHCDEWVAAANRILANDPASYGLRKSDFTVAK